MHPAKVVIINLRIFHFPEKSSAIRKNRHHAKIQSIDYQSITTLARRWLYTLQIKQIFKKFKTQKFKIQITQNEKLN